MRFKVGDRVELEGEHHGQVSAIHEEDQTVSVKWDDGFTDDLGDIFAEWEIDAEGHPNDGYAGEDK